jgi:hypothetical protein
MEGLCMRGGRAVAGGRRGWWSAAGVATGAAIRRPLANLPAAEFAVNLGEQSSDRIPT